ncbi:MAG: hypothetical protein JSW52_06735 [Candidatus Coatesbacteria bacterium]|nr:MAG: hypothetical protein JSW52_06735 [Candidatus Coatesbacteria bacterium]
MKKDVLVITAVVFVAFVFLSAPVAGGEDFYAELTIGKPLIHDNLAVYPVRLPGGGEELGEIITMDEAMSSGKFKITELEEGADVNTLEVRNDTGKNVVIFAGEIVRGAKQDRIISYDTVVPPVGRYTVDVFCVEAGRWTEVSDSFAYKKEIAPASVRGTAQGDKDQGKVWEAVSNVNAEVAGVITQTDALTASYDAEEFQEKAEAYEKAFKELADDDDVVGVVVVSEGTVQAGDVFANHDLFAVVWPRLLTSYSMDAVLSEELGDVPTADEIGDYLSQLKDADRVETYADETQNRSTLSNDEMNAYELEYDGKKMHVNVYME